MSDNNAYRAEIEDGNERIGFTERQVEPPQPPPNESVNLFHDVFRDPDPNRVNGQIIVKYSFKFFAVIAIFSFIGSCIGSFIAYNIFKGF